LKEKITAQQFYIWLLIEILLPSLALTIILYFSKKGGTDELS